MTIGIRAVIAAIDAKVVILCDFLSKSSVIRFATYTITIQWTIIDRFSCF